MKERFKNQNVLRNYLKSSNYLEILDEEWSRLDEKGNYKSDVGAIKFFTSPIEGLENFLEDLNKLKHCTDSKCFYENSENFKNSVYDELTIILVNNKKYHLLSEDDISLDKNNKKWILIYRTWCKCKNLNNNKIIFNIKINVKKWQNELQNYEKLINTKYLKNFNILKENTNYVKKNKDNTAPILIYSKSNYAKQKINIDKMIFPIIKWKDYAFFGNFAGDFINRKDKFEFYYFINELINSKFGICQNFQLKWIDEIYTFLSWNKNLKVIDINSSKLEIFKFDAPDFIIKVNSQNIYGIEVTKANDEWHYEIESNFLKSDQGPQSHGINKYEKISESNLENIKKHFKKHKNYIKNVVTNQDLIYENNININDIKILYLVPLGGAGRLDIEEKEQLEKIIKLAQENKIKLENIYVQISKFKEKTNHFNHWYSLTEFNK